MEQTQSKKILMIEDEEVFIDIFGKKLEQAGFEITFAKNGAWGVKEALANRYDLFLIDMVMPAMSGEEIVEKLKMEEETRNVPIVVLSASVDEETQKKVVEMGVAAFFVKTHITPEELLEKISQILA